MEKKNILLLDFSSETNIGDIALQEGLLLLVKKYISVGVLRISVIFGANQYKTLNNHFHNAFESKYQVVGSLRHTFYPVKRKYPVFVMELLNVFGLTMGIFIFLLLLTNRNFFVKFLPSDYKKTCSAIEQSDFVIWKGKNFRNTHWLIEPYRVLSRLFMPLVVIAIFKKPIANIGVSIWPLSNIFSRYLLKYTLNKCVHISAREESTYKELKKYISNDKFTQKVNKYPDLSFALLKNCERKQVSYDNSIKNISLTLVDWHGFGSECRKNYINSLSNFLDYVVRNYSLNISIVPQVIKEWESSSSIEVDIFNHINDTTKSKLKVIELDHGFFNVLNHYKNSDILIATRMHSAIFALSVNTPVIAIPYDIGAKWNILNELGCEKYLIPYNNLSEQKLIDSFEDLLINRHNIMKNISKNIDFQFNNVDKCITDIIKYI